jgi:hypothetical protein
MMAHGKLTRIAACGILALGGLVAFLSADQPDTAVEQRSATKIDALAFLAGVWTGEMRGTFVEEAWSRPQGNNIVGYFRWLRPDGTPMLFEILTITEEDDVLRLRLRHYSAVLHGKEAPDKPITLRLGESGASRAVFTAEKDAGDLSHVSYEVADDVLTIRVEFVQEGREALVFRLRRAE